MKPAGIKTKLRGPTGRRSSLILAVGQTNFHQLLCAPATFDLHWTREETLSLNPEENGSADPANPQISSHQFSVDSKTRLRTEANAWQPAYSHLFV
jgi:hypothetical protein